MTNATVIDLVQSRISVIRGMELVFVSLVIQVSSVINVRAVTMITTLAGGHQFV